MTLMPVASTIASMDDDTRIPVRIGELAADVQLNPKTIRYYEEIGLLPAPRRTAAGYRQYSAADRERLRFIAKAKVLGFTLREIGELLALRDGGEEPCSYLGQLLDHKLAAIEVQLALLTELRAEFQALRMEMATTACSSTPICGIIELHEPAHTR
jgi:MerR family transcriptional regulator, Zn(II)-responsive regulator of zntA